MAEYEQIIIVEGIDVKKFTKEVNEHLANGAQLHGNIVIQTHLHKEKQQSYDSRDPDYYTTVLKKYFAQALVIVPTGP